MAVKIGLIGTGTVGGGCIDIIQKHREDFKRHFGLDIELVQVSSRRPNCAESHGIADLYTPNVEDVVNNPDVDIVIELIGGTTTARTLVETALKNGKSVVTANKALMADCGGLLLHLASEHDCEILFEGSVGGGIPIIGPMKHSLIANELQSVMGIVNGTTNYMLTRMDADHMSYDDVLKEAQDKGYAEADPTADVDGHDAAAKIAILSSIAFNSRVSKDDVYTEGIRNLTPADLKAAREMGYCVKLLALGTRMKEGIDVRVHPTMLPLDHPMATVNGVFNAIYTVGDFVGESMFFGEGAGAGAAASAVMGDVLEAARHIQAGIKPYVGCTCTDKLSIVPISETVQRYYLRVTVADSLGVLASIARTFAQNGVSVHSVIQRGAAHEENDGAGTVDLIYVTHRAKEKDIMSSIEDMKALENVIVPGCEPVLIRIAGK